MIPIMIVCIFGYTISATLTAKANRYDALMAWICCIGLAIGHILRT